MNVSSHNPDFGSTEAMLQAVFASSRDMIQVFRALRDESGKIIDFVWLLNNRVSEDAYGDVVGKRLLENNPGVLQTGIFDAFVEVTETGVPKAYEVRYAHEQFDAWYHQTAVKVGDGVVTSTADITARKTAEMAISQLNGELLMKNQELESVYAELRTFNDIAANDYQVTLHKLYVNFEQILKVDAMGLTDSSKANLRRAQGAVQKLKLLTDDILAFSRLSELDRFPAEVDLSQCVKEVVAALQARFGKDHVGVSFDGELPVITGYPTPLTFLFRHLLDNAQKFVSPGESASIRISHRIVGELPGLAPGSYHEIAVADRGIGFDSRHAEQLFAIFYRGEQDRSRYKGSGVGLAVCRKVMALHRGHITATGRPGEGAVFSCYFPVSTTR